jgi:hypothetical protein
MKIFSDFFRKTKCSCGKDVYFGDYSRMVNAVALWGEKKSVCFDKCLADEIFFLWSVGVKTSQSCCGHNLSCGGIYVHEGDTKKMVRLGYKEYKKFNSFFVPKSVSRNKKYRHYNSDVVINGFRWDYEDYPDWSIEIDRNFTESEIGNILSNVAKSIDCFKRERALGVSGAYDAKVLHGSLKHLSEFSWALMDALELKKLKGKKQEVNYGVVVQSMSRPDENVQGSGELV